VADDLIEKSGCKWVIVRPMSFTKGAKTGNISVITDMSLTVPAAPQDRTCGRRGIPGRASGKG
jgi:hypothetical protein